MSLSWTAPADVLADCAEPGWAGIWTLTHAAAHAALHLADALPLVEGVELVYAASYLREAQGKLESAWPDLPARCAAVDLGPLDPDDDLTQAQDVLDQLASAALDRTWDLFDTHLTITEALIVADVDDALRGAQWKILGLQP